MTSSVKGTTDGVTCPDGAFVAVADSAIAIVGDGEWLGDSVVRGVVRGPLAIVVRAGALVAIDGEGVFGVFRIDDEVMSEPPTLRADIRGVDQSGPGFVSNDNG